MGTESMENSYQIPFISDDERNAIKNMSVYALPDSPAAYGMKAGAVKPNFWKPLVCGDGSLVGLINTMIGILNGILADVKKKQSLAGSVVSAVTVQEDGKLTFTFEGGKEITTDQSVKGEKGDPGKDGENGDDYVLTDADKNDIAGIVLGLLPVAEGASF